MTSCLVPRARDAVITAQARRILGFVPTLLDYVAPCPWLARAEIAFFATRPAHLPVRIAELVPYAVALDRGCRHCTGAFRSLLRLAGYPDEQRALEAGPPFADLRAGEAEALEHAVLVARGMHPDPARLAATGFAPLAQAELTALAAFIVFGTRVATPLAIPPDAVEAFERSLLGKLLRPVIEWRIRSSRKPSVSPPVVETHGEVVPDVVALLAGSPFHTLARNVLADAWSSTILPTREKALVLWAVADALGARMVAADARKLVGELPGSRDDCLIDYGRATVTATPVVLQQHARELAGVLSRPELLEVVGIAALANTIGRVGMQLDDPRSPAFAGSLHLGRR